MRLLFLSVLVSAALIGTSPGTAGAADKPTFGPSDIVTLFFINKSDDKNRVDYGMRLNADCTPSEKEAVFPYWREFEKAPPVRTHPLNMFEYYPYGIAAQRVLNRSPNGVEYHLRLKRIHRDLFVVTNKAADGRCTAAVYTTIGGINHAELHSAFAKLQRAMSVAYVEIHGRDPRTDRPLVERVTE